MPFSVAFPASEGCFWRLWTYRIPQGQLPLTHAAEARGEDLPVGEEQSSHGPGPLVNFLLHLKAEQLKSQPPSHHNLLRARF